MKVQVKIKREKVFEIKNKLRIDRIRLSKHNFEITLNVDSKIPSTRKVC